MAKNKKLWLDMCAGSELKDTQGETLSVEGADITELMNGSGRLNDNHGKGFFNSLGRITEAKKIFKAEDCDNERQKYYWEKIKAPYIYCKGYLYNDEDHPNAKAAAAILKNIHRDDVPLRMKASVEGGVISRGITDATRLARTKIHSVALTFTPANNATLVEPLNVDKSDSNWEVDKQLIKSVAHLAETNIPSFRHIERHASAHTIFENMEKIQELAKSLGIEIEIKEHNPEMILENAIFSKITNNVNKIHSLVKALKSPKGLAQVKQVADENRSNRIDDYQQNFKRLKTNPTTPPKLNSDLDTDNLKTSDPKKWQAQTTLKLHASKMMRDPEHAQKLRQGLISSGRVTEEQADQILSGIQNFIGRQKLKKSEFKKALCAGYGGAGTPTAMTGGSVIQAESLEDSEKKPKKKVKKLSKAFPFGQSFKYLTCDNCGQEQVHMKYQVKCRNCRQNFPLDKLKNLI